MTHAGSTVGGTFSSSSSVMVVDLEMNWKPKPVVWLCSERKWVLQWSRCLCMPGDVLALE